MWNDLSLGAVVGPFKGIYGGGALPATVVKNDFGS